MASVSGSYRVGNVLTIAAAIILIDAQLDVEEARLTVLAGASTLITGSLTLAITAENAGVEVFTHRVSISLNCLTVADAKTLTAALSTFGTVMETESDYTTVTVVAVSLSTTFSN